MERICQGVRFFYLEKGQGDQTFLCIHNTGGDHRLFLPQLEFFSQFGRVITLDLRGHGKSDKPKKKYSIEVFGEDLVHLCKELSISSVIAIGSSTGGNVALDLACRHPHFVKGAVMIDCGMFLSSKVRQKIREYQEKMKQDDISEISDEILRNSCLATDRCIDVMREAYRAVPSYVWAGAFASLLKWDRKSKQRLAECKAPILYIEACAPSQDQSQLTNLKEFFKHYPSLMMGKVVGSGHYPSLEVADQVNGMILQFLRVRGLLLST